MPALLSTLTEQGRHMKVHTNVHVRLYITLCNVLTKHTCTCTHITGITYTCSTELYMYMYMYIFVHVYMYNTYPVYSLLYTYECARDYIHTVHTCINI